MDVATNDPTFKRLEVVTIVCPVREFSVDAFDSPNVAIRGFVNTASEVPFEMTILRTSWLLLSATNMFEDELIPIALGYLNNAAVPNPSA